MRNRNESKRASEKGASERASAERLWGRTTSTNAKALCCCAPCALELEPRPPRRLHTHGTQTAQQPISPGQASIICRYPSQHGPHLVAGSRLPRVQPPQASHSHSGAERELPQDPPP